MIILDTNVVSEVIKLAPSEQVLQWLADQPRAQLHITAVTEAEVWYGIEQLDEGKRRAALQAAIIGMFEEDFRDKILPFDSGAARLFGQIAAQRKAAGRAVSQFDAQIAAIAASYNATVATRNIAHFENCGVNLINPWTVGQSQRAG